MGPWGGPTGLFRPAPSFAGDRLSVVLTALHIVMLATSSLQRRAHWPRNTKQFFVFCLEMTTEFKSMIGDGLEGQRCTDVLDSQESHADRKCQMLLSLGGGGKDKVPAIYQM